ncbi:Uma2 family endonuclease [bacterium]|nr:MAG: Uma2 family endonuclease [bacterium]
MNGPSFKLRGMDAAPQIKLLSEAEYFEMDARSSIKREFWHGQIVTRPNCTPSHVILAGQVTTALTNQLRETPCEVGTSDLKVKSGTDNYVFPDVVVWCEDAQWDSRHPNILLNPHILVEILSPSTQSIDQGAKLAAYQTIPSLLDYLIVWPDMVQIEHYARQTETDWRFRRYLNRSQTIEFVAQGLKIPVAEIYRRLDVPEGVFTLELPFESDDDDE